MISTTPKDALNPYIVFTDFEKQHEGHGYNLQEIVELFKNNCFKEDPYKYTLEALVTEHHSCNSVGGAPLFVLMRVLPDFNTHVSVNLLERIADEKFRNNPQYDKIMQVFKSSIHTEDFLMHFEFYRNHKNIIELNALLRSLFKHASLLKNFTINEEYKRQRDFANSFE